MAVDDAGAVPEKHLEFEFGIVQGQPEKGRREQKLPVMAFTYGLYRGLELGLGIHRLNSDLKGERPVRGFQDLHLAAKYNFLEESAWPALALAFDLKIPTANRRVGLSTGRFDEQFLLIATKNFSLLAANLNFGYLIVDSPPKEKLLHRLLGGVALRYEVNKQWRLVGDIFGQSRQARGDENEANFQLGFQYQPFPPLTFDAAIGRSLLRSGTRIHGTLGLTWLHSLSSKP
ncbi:MAG: hypothetical protein ACREQP_07775 [Candidatus Binatia bacterium]